VRGLNILLVRGENFVLGERLAFPNVFIDAWRTRITKQKMPRPRRHAQIFNLLRLFARLSHLTRFSSGLVPLYKDFYNQHTCSLYNNMLQSEVTLTTNLILSTRLIFSDATSSQPLILG